MSCSHIGVVFPSGYKTASCVGCSHIGVVFPSGYKTASCVSCSHIGVVFPSRYKTLLVLWVVLTLASFSRASGPLMYFLMNVHCQILKKFGVPMAMLLVSWFGLVEENASAMFCQYGIYFLCFTVVESQVLSG